MLAHDEARIPHMNDVMCFCRKQGVMVLLQPQSSSRVRWSSRGVMLPLGTLKDAMIRLAGFIAQVRYAKSGMEESRKSTMMRIEPKDRLI
jgi:hypothetical protein